MPLQINCPKSWTHFLFPTPQQKTPERHYTSCAIHPVCLCIGYTFPFLLIDAQLKKKVHNQGFFISHLFSFKPQKFPAVKEAQAATCIRDPITHPGHYSASLCVFFVRTRRKRRFQWFWNEIRFQSGGGEKEKTFFTDRFVSVAQAAGTMMTHGRYLRR